MLEMTNENLQDCLGGYVRRGQENEPYTLLYQFIAAEIRACTVHMGSETKSPTNEP
jgi:hypothetical protein